MRKSWAFKFKEARMDTAMAISGETIRSLREAKAWSQAHLAEAAG